MQTESFNQAVKSGWGDKEVSFPEMIALLHSELSEALESYRKGEPVRQYICHSIITDGAITYCSDSTHSLKGQTVPMPDWPYDE